MKKNTALKKYVELVSRKHGGLDGLRHLIDTNKIRPSTFALESAAPERHTESARRAVESLALDREPQHEETFALEAIINADIRPVIDIVGGKYQSTHPLWTQLSTDAGIRQRLEAAFASIGRIDLPGNDQLPYGGTAFIVGKNLIMTNRHVAEIFTQGLGTKNLQFTPGTAGIDFLHERDLPTGPLFKGVRVKMIHPYWDMALIEVEDLGKRPTLKLALEDARDLRGRDIAVVGYPAFDPRNPPDVQSNLFGGRYGIKRLQPGELQGGMEAASFQKMVHAATHDCSTLGGNSGSAVVDLATGTVFGLHFGGRYHEQNYAVPSCELARDRRVIDAGVTFASTPQPDGTDWADWWARADENEAAKADASAPAAAPQATATTITTNSTVSGSGVDGDGRAYHFDIPLRITVSLGGSPVSPKAAAGKESTDTTEAMRAPWHDTNYQSRRGYDPEFLVPSGAGNNAARYLAPMPQAKDPAVLAKTKTGADVLHYQNFSLRMHAKRRLALVTACNVTREPALRKPEPGRDYTRKALAGFGKNDMEQWFLDPRLDPKYQLPDVFFTKDRQAFDKGHIVRRDDVAWGRTYEQLRRGNGDSYHVTNCSPQVSSFNQSAQGVDNWGDLENHVYAEAASERLSVFAGPVLDAHDRVFHGAGDGGQAILARVPSRFWKIIIAQVENGIASFGFVLEQDLADVEWEEFTVAPNFAPAMYPLTEIAQMTGVVFDDAVLGADQYDTVRGVELAHRNNVRRRRPRTTEPETVAAPVLVK